MTYYDPILFGHTHEARPLAGSAEFDGGLPSDAEADYWLEILGTIEANSSRPGVEQPRSIIHGPPLQYMYGFVW